MGNSRESAVAAVNGLTSRWLRGVPEDCHAVLSGVGLWPLLAALQLGARGEGESALADATGMSRAHAGSALREMATVLEESVSVHAALGLWASCRLRLDAAWLGELPIGAAGQFSGDAATDQTLLDSWASSNTDGLVPSFPVEIDEGVDLVLASALGLRTRWREPFDASPWSFWSGPWSGGQAWHGLTRVGTDLSPLGVWDNGVTTLTVAGEDDVDVVLVLGDQARQPPEVLVAGMHKLANPTGFTPVEDLPLGRVAPGVEVALHQDTEPDPAPWLRVTTVAFDVSADHDLLEDAVLFGLEQATNERTSPLTAMTDPADAPIVVSQAAQRAVARFSAVGFEAAAVTAMAAMAGAAMPSPDGGMRRIVSVAFDRPFGYLAVHRPTGLVVVAGWVDEPLRWPDY